MASFINTNISSLNAQRNLASSQSALQTSLQRLSSGLRINSAKDDAAGLAIANRFTTQINGLDQAQRNANDGISLAQTADGALSSISDNLQRIRELAVQAANSTNSASDRAAINEEVQQRLAEIDRTSSQTSFNGQKILDGNFGTAAFQVGANAGETINVDLNSSMRTGAIGAIATATSTNVLGASATGGSISTGAINATDFSHTDVTAVDESLTLTPLSTVFGATSDATSTIASGFTGYDFSTQAVNGGNGYNNASAVTDFDYSGGGANVAQFDVSDGTTTAHITLSANYTDANGVATEITNQINATTGMDMTVTAEADGTLKFVNNNGTAAVKIENADVNAKAAGIVDDSVTGANLNHLIAGAGGTLDGTTALGKSFDFSSTNATFVVDGGSTITLDGDYSGDTSYATLAADIAAKVTAAGGGDTYTASIDDDTGKLTITDTTGSTAGVITAANAAATGVGIFNDADVTRGDGVTGVAATAQTFTIGGHSITLDTNIASAGDLATELQTQLQTYDAGYTVTEDTGTLTIDRAGSSSASDVAIAGTSAFTDGVGDIDTAGTAGSASAAASFTLDGQSITLTGVSGISDLVTALSDGLNTAVPNTYTVAANSDGSIKISKNGVQGGTLSITAPDAQAAATGFGTTDGVADIGTAADTSTAASFKIDGTTVTLNQNDANIGDVKSDMQQALDTAFGSGKYTADLNDAGTGLTITNNTTGSSAVVISAADTNAQGAGIQNASNGTDGTTSGTVTVGDLSIKVGDNSAVTINAKTYASVDDLAAEINLSVGGAYATVNSGKLTLTSADAITLGGTDGSTMFSSTSIAANSGSLDSGDTLTVDDANSLIQRVDSALGSVNSLRSTFGAVQNRFDSVISNLSSTSENLSAARSRIQDADFAAETASLTRGQILQQAGTAMLAQANSLPNNVLSLLR